MIPPEGFSFFITFPPLRLFLPLQKHLLPWLSLGAHKSWARTELVSGRKVPSFVRISINARGMVQSMILKIHEQKRGKIMAAEGEEGDGRSDLRLPNKAVP